MTVIAHADHRAVGHIQRRKQRGCPMALVIVSHRSAAALLQRQTRLGAVQGLDLTLLVDTHHDRVLGWIQIEPHDVFQFLGETLILANLEALQKMRFQPMGVPDAAYRCLTDAHFDSHSPGTPMTGIGRFGLRRLTNLWSAKIMCYCHAGLFSNQYSWWRPPSTALRRTTWPSGNWWRSALSGGGGLSGSGMPGPRLMCARP